MAKSKSQAKLTNVQYQRKELVNLLPQYCLIRDAIDGEPAIKGLQGHATYGIGGIGNGGIPVTVNNILVSQAKRYLPQPNAEDQSDANNQRYLAYVTRAIFYGVTGRTLNGMAGQIFLRDPVVELPDELELMKIDANGGALSLDQMAARSVRSCIAYGRSGLFVDYPATSAPATKQDLKKGNLKPTFTVYEPWAIRNWRIKMIGAKRVLTLVVLYEEIDEEDDDNFEPNTYYQYRVLRLTPAGDYITELWKKDGTGQGISKSDTFFPKDSTGKPLSEIPFHFIGSEDNDVIPNRPPMYDLAAVNIGHYRNSADYEEACFIAGQPTPVLSGLTEDWVKNIIGGVVTLGSRAAIPLPIGAKADLLQAQENSMPMEAMKHKEQQMVALGARLVQAQPSAKSATAKIIDETSENSMLANIAKNVSAAFVWGLTKAASFVGAVSDGIKYELNDDFDLTSMTADDQNAVILQWQSAGIAYEEMRTVLRRAGTVTMDDDKARVAIQKDIDDGMIPDPSMPNASAVPPAKGASDAGGPQPTRVRRQPKP